MQLPERKIYSVTEFTEKIREILEKEYPSIWIRGEISNRRAAPSGHIYFTLKDEASQIKCVMFRLQSRFLKFRPEDGLSVIAWGRLSVYSPRGEYQLILDTMEPAGLGSLTLAFEQLKRKLSEEGLFDSSRKRPLPPIPKRIGIVTSPTGAAVQDMIRIIRRRLPGINILVSPALVQGDRAPDELTAALDRLCMAQDVDAVIIGRGGGSIEDLWAFNDERVVRAVASCPLPIVSAVGHETDFTLTDFAADLRASTPSAAAEILAPEKRSLEEVILGLAGRMAHCVHRALDRRRAALDEMAVRLRDPKRQIQERLMRMDDLAMRLVKASRRRVSDIRASVTSLAERLRPERLLRGLLNGREAAETLCARLEKDMRKGVSDRRAALEALTARLEALSPPSVLARGYSIALRTDTGEVITDARDIRLDEDIQVRLHRGRLACRITGKEDQ